MGMTPEQAFQQAISVSKNYTKKSLEGAGALKGDPGFSPIVSSKPVVDGVEVSITDSTHTETFVIKNDAGSEIDTEKNDIDFSGYFA